MSGGGKAGDSGLRGVAERSNGGGDGAKVAEVEEMGGASKAVAECAAEGARHEGEDCVCSSREATAVWSLCIPSILAAMACNRERRLLRFRDLLTGRGTGCAGGIGWGGRGGWPRAARGTMAH